MDVFTSTFEYTNAQVSEKRVPASGRIKVTVDVTNTGERDGDEVVQLYLSHPRADGIPIRSLAGFRRVNLDRGETKTVGFTLEDRALSQVDANGVRRIVPGAIKLWIGGGQADRHAGLPPVAGIWAEFEVTSSAILSK